MLGDLGERAVAAALSVLAGEPHPLAVSARLLGANLPQARSGWTSRLREGTAKLGSCQDAVAEGVAEVGQAAVAGPAWTWMVCPMVTWAGYVSGSVRGQAD